MTTNHTTSHQFITHSPTQTKSHQINYLNNSINTSTWLAQCIYAPSWSTLHAQCTCQAHIHIIHMSFVRMSYVVSDFDSSLKFFFVFSYLWTHSFAMSCLVSHPRLCEWHTHLLFLASVQFNASCRAICLLFSFRLFLAMLWACHRFLFFFALYLEFYDASITMNDLKRFNWLSLTRQGNLRSSYDTCTWGYVPVNLRHVQGAKITLTMNVISVVLHCHTQFLS